MNYEKMRLQLVSMNGDVVHNVEAEPNTSEIRIDIPASVPEGVYYLMIINGPVKRTSPCYAHNEKRLPHGNRFLI